MSTVKTEQVMVVPTELFRSLGYFQGFSTDVDKYLTTLLDVNHTSYRPRPEMEEDPSFKQLIPYVIFRHTDENGDQRIFRYTRGKGQGESRLHSKQSIGVGGHICSDDESDESTYRVGMKRELEEEVSIDCEWTESCVGLLNDDTNDVGQVHLGVVHIIDVKSPGVSPRENEMIDCQFVDLDELRKNRDRLETWSQICLDHIFS